MSDSLTATVLLFSYGTLQDKAVQMANFGRHLTGRPDSLPGYMLSSILIEDPAVVALSGRTHHSIAQSSSKITDEVQGTVFEITVEELAAADRYEVSEYTRVSVALKSGAQAWVYVRA
ncbi:MAG: gamma-glutamylcyclotransferase [Pseudomonadota bacterium]|nr:gamma-glutamylcyclotransferase [Pseudomonadota bacterium]